MRIEVAIHYISGRRRPQVSEVDLRGLLALPPLPRRERIRVRPQPVFRLARFPLELLECRVVRRIVAKHNAVQLFYD
jgi:hypothetical protein